MACIKKCKLKDMIARIWHGLTKIEDYDAYYLLEFEEKVIHYEVFAE